jgi:hypothetical protein
LWRLARNHAWAQWSPEESVTGTVPTHERGRAKDVAARLAHEPFIIHHPQRGLKIAHEGIDLLARELRDECGISEFRIETTLSHFGGFD